MGKTWYNTGTTVTTPVTIRGELPRGTVQCKRPLRVARRSSAKAWPERPRRMQRCCALLMRPSKIRDFASSIESLIKLRKQAAPARDELAMSS